MGRPSSRCSRRRWTSRCSTCEPQSHVTVVTWVAAVKVDAAIQVSWRASAGEPVGKATHDSAKRAANTERGCLRLRSPSMCEKVNVFKRCTCACSCVLDHKYTRTFEPRCPRGTISKLYPP